MNWGKGIIIGLVLFMSFIVVLVVLMFRSPDDAFDKKYYEKGLAFNDIYNQKQNVIDEKVEPQFLLNSKTLQINFSGVQSGQINFTRPSNHLLDTVVNINRDTVIIPIKNLTTGQWHLILKWKNLHKDYLFEKDIFIP